MKFRNIFWLVLVLSGVFVSNSFAAEKSADAAEKSAEITVITGAYDDPNNFHFVVLGDRTGREQKGVLPAIVQKINLLMPAFVVSVGDSIQGYTEDVNLLTQQWNEFDKIIGNLKTPFFKTAGNHDMTNDIEAGVYKQRYGRPYYHVLYRNVLFLFVNTQDPCCALSGQVKAELDKDYAKLKKMIKTEGYTASTMAFFEEYEAKVRRLDGAKISDEQLEYFKMVLDENKNVRWTFVILHKPLWKEPQPTENWINLEKLLSERPYTIFAGHEHMNAYAQRNNRDYIIMSTSGGGWVWPRTLPGVYHHILWVTMDNKGPVIANILTDGIMDKTDIKPIGNIISNNNSNDKTSATPIQD